MKACRLRSPAPIEQNPLEWVEIEPPEPGADEVRIRARVCAVCRTDLHVVEGDLPPRRPRVIPGHQVVGTIDKLGSETKRFRLGDRVGVPWLHRTCGRCEYCSSGRENLCDDPGLTGYSVDGGYAELVVAPESFIYRIPDVFTDLEAAPLLCAGIVGFRSLRLSRIGQGGKLGLYGFGAAAHVAIQVARHWNAEVYAFTRDRRHQRHAIELGAVWAGAATDLPPSKLDAAVLFAPAGELVPAALSALKKGATLAIGGIHMSPIPELDYRLLYHERVITSVANNTRRDGEEFLRTAAEIPIRTEVESFPLGEANRALQAHKRGAVRGAAVLQIS